MLKIIAHYRQTFADSFRAIILFLNPTGVALQNSKCITLTGGVNYWEIKQAQLMLTNLRDAFMGQSRSPNIVQFHMLGVVSD